MLRVSRKLCQLLLSALCLNSTAVQAADTGTSHNLFLLDRIDSDKLLVARANLVTRDGTSDTFFGYLDANIRWTLDGPWSLEAGYRHAMLELPSGWREEYRPMFALYWQGKIAEGRFSNRNRLELRYFEGNAQDRVRYRNESVWRASYQLGSLALSPYIEEELFYDLTDSVLNGNWLTVGFSKRWTKHIRWKLGYRLQSQKFNADWQHRHVLVTGLSFFYLD